MQSTMHNTLQKSPDCNLDGEDTQARKCPKHLMNKVLSQLTIVIIRNEEKANTINEHNAKEEHTKTKPYLIHKVEGKSHHHLIKGQIRDICGVVLDQDLEGGQPEAVPPEKHTYLIVEQHTKHQPHHNHDYEGLWNSVQEELEQILHQHRIHLLYFDVLGFGVGGVVGYAQALLC